MKKRKLYIKFIRSKKEYSLKKIFFKIQHLKYKKNNFKKKYFFLCNYIKKYSLIFQEKCLSGIHQYFLISYLEILLFLNSVLLEHIKLINFYEEKIKENLDILNKCYIELKKWINLEKFYQRKMSIQLMRIEQREYDNLIENYCISFLKNKNKF